MRLNEASILIVDDDPTLGKLMANWIQRKAAHSFYAENGEQALQILGQETIDLVLSDIRMPVMDGIALLKRVKEISTSKPVLMFITGFSDISLRDAYAMGAEALLEKPIDRSELLKIMTQFLADPESRWREPSTTRPTAKLSGTFPSLVRAEQDSKIAFGRGGFCISSPAAFVEGRPVGFVFVFTADQKGLSGEGVVRWISPKEAQNGVEVTYVDDASRDWLIQFLKQNERVAFVPSSLGIGEARKAA